MEHVFLNIIQETEHCLMPKLARNSDESETHSEYNIWLDRLDQHLPTVFKLLDQIDLNANLELSSRVLASLMIVLLELNSSGAWSSDKCKLYSKQLKNRFELLHETPLETLLQNGDVFDVQKVFDECFLKLHQKLTLTHFKRYPSLIEVYCSFVRDVQSYDVSLIPQTTLPISLLLIDDFGIANKIKGLKCCAAILECLSPEDFSDGNYYEVIYGCLVKALLQKDNEVTELVVKCFIQLLRVLPDKIKIEKTDELYSNMMDQLSTESNLYRKAELFRFTKSLIEIHGVNCVKKTIFRSIVCDSIDACCNPVVGAILLYDVLECLEEWIKHCWCIWQLSRDQKLLSVLFKYLYLSKEGNLTVLITNLIVTLINLSTKYEQDELVKAIENSVTKCKSEEFHQKMDAIKKYLT